MHDVLGAIGIQVAPSALNLSIVLALAVLRRRLGVPVAHAVGL